MGNKNGCLEGDGKAKQDAEGRPCVDDAIGVDEDLDSDDDDDDVVDDLPEVRESNNGGPRARKSVSAEVYGPNNAKGDFKPPVFPKTADQTKRIEATLSKSFLFSALDADDLKTVILAFQEYKIPPKTTIITQGDEGDCLYLLEEGNCNVFKKTSSGGEEHVFVQKPGDAFGELALLYNAPRAATVRAGDDPTLLWKLDRRSFNHIVKDAAVRKREAYEGFLADVKLLADMEPYERAKLSDGLKERTFKDGEYIIRQGEEGDTFYLIMKGNPEAIKDGKTVKKYQKGEYFGELALIRDQPRAANVVAKGPVTCAYVERRSFKRLLGPVESILQRNAIEYKTLQRSLSKQPSQHASSLG
eukprot:GHVU01032651.1.p1 GENE.GHVU01032651.1~~GHVU01032651.1.p1  ORF type:complete len:358 (-),score=81.75 GHVU01032651.1:461-1534(-)